MQLQQKSFAKDELHQNIYNCVPSTELGKDLSKLDDSEIKSDPVQM